MIAQFQTRSDAPRSPFTPVRGGLLQRKCACGGTPGRDGECEACRKKRLARKRDVGRTGEFPAAPPLVHAVLRSAGQPLDASARAFMEPRFGHDFGQVRVHTDAKAAESARSVRALAYTVGRDIVFDSGRYAPETDAGRRLLAHELAHVGQQGRQASPPAGGALGVEEADTPAEREAESVSARVVSGARITPGAPAFRPSAHPPAVQRQSGSEVGNFVIRLNESGSVEFLYGTPNVPIVGSVGVGFRCRSGGGCEPVAGSDPSRVTNRTYTLDEALGVLRGSVGGPGPGGGPLSSGAGRGPGGGTTLPPDVQLCLPWQRTPSGRCCPPGEQWSGRGNLCEPASATPATPGLTTPGPTLVPPLPPPGLSLGLGQLQLRVIAPFASDSDALPAGADEILDRLAAELNGYPNAEVEVEGHTDSTHTAAHNQALSERRAATVRQALIDRSVDAGRLRAVGMGERRLLRPEERTPEDRAANRRVAVWFRVPQFTLGVPGLPTLPGLTLPRLTPPTP